MSTNITKNLWEFGLESTKRPLENNNCRFKDEFYKEISGQPWALGTIFAATYATLTMEYFEVYLYNI